ncbi:MAG: hypothetical protein WC675_05455 [Patescibacteria group bacterium]
MGRPESIPSNPDSPEAKKAALRQRASELFWSKDNTEGRELWEQILETADISETTPEERAAIEQIGSQVNRRDETYEVGRYFPLDADAMKKSDLDGFTSSTVRLRKDYDAIVMPDLKIVTSRAKVENTLQSFPNRDIGWHSSKPAEFFARNLNVVDRHETETMPDRPADHKELFGKLRKADLAIVESVRKQLAEKEKGPGSRVEAVAA